MEWLVGSMNMDSLSQFGTQKLFIKQDDGVNELWRAYYMQGFQSEAETVLEKIKREF